MNVSVEQVIARELAGGERLLWYGQPRQGMRLQAADAVLIPFSIMWGGFAIFWEWSVLHTEAPFFFRLWGIPFVLVGLYVMVGRFFVDARQRATTHYGLTDQRAIIISGVTSRQVKSLPIRSLSDVSITERSTGGTITFGAALPIYGWLSGTSWPGMNRFAPPAFEGISEPRRVYELLREAQQKAA
jgi:hypothetical protein